MKTNKRKKFLDLFKMTAPQYSQHMGPQLAKIHDGKLFQNQMRECFRYMFDHYSTAEIAGIMNFWLNKKHVTDGMMEHCVECAFYTKFAHRFNRLKSIKSVDCYGNIGKRMIFPTYV